MTHRLTIGADPGGSGALSFLADERAIGYIDMPTSPRPGGGNQVDAVSLAAQLRERIAQHHGAYVVAVIELVSAMPKQGVTTTFRFGQADGILRGVLGAQRVPVVEVQAKDWKRYLRLTGKPKDAALTLARQLYPEATEWLRRKKDCGRADALLLARWGTYTEAVGARAA